jgi:hypothetical protein
MTTSGFAPTVEDFAAKRLLIKKPVLIAKLSILQELLFFRVVKNIFE